MSNYGSIKKLNWVEPKFAEKKTGTIAHSESGDVSKSIGAPPTRRAHSALSPAVKHENPLSLYLSKAVLTPTKYGPGGAQFQRKRDASGKFSSAQDAGSASTAEEDQVDQQRGARQRHHKMRDQLMGKVPTGQAATAQKAIPGAGEDLMASANDTSAPVVGQTQSGMPIYDDPFHSQHEGFSEQDHMEASELHRQLAQQAQQAGDAPAAAKHNADADAHMQRGADGKAPGSRFMDNLFGAPGVPEVQPQDMGQFQDLLGVDAPPPQSPAVAGPSDPMMAAQDPMMAAQDPMMSPPEMGAPDPVSAPPSIPGQDPGMFPSNQAPAEGQPQPDPLSTFMGQDDMAPEQDQNKPLSYNPEESGPKPGMIDTRTGGPVGPQTEVGSPPPQEAAPEEEPMLDVPESNAGFPGPDAGYNEEEEELSAATQKALKALSRYV